MIQRPEIDGRGCLAEGCWASVSLSLRRGLIGMLPEIWRAGAGGGERREAGRSVKRPKARNSRAFGVVGL